MSSFTEAFPRPTRLAFAALVSLVVLAGCWIPKASAGTKIQLTGSSSYPLQSWVNAAKAPTPTTTVKVAFQNCDVGCSSYNAITGIGSIKIAKNASEALAEKVLYHELGHVFADRHMYAADRATATAILGIPAGTAWRGTYGNASPSEWFAEAAAQCYKGPNYHQTLVAYGFPFKYGSAQVQGICQLMAKAVKQTPRVMTSFSVNVPASKKLETAATFEAGTITATITVGGKTGKSQASCTDQVKSNVGSIYVNTCNKKAVVFSHASRQASVVIQGVPVAAPLVKATVLSAIVSSSTAKAKKKKKKQKNRR